MDLGSLEELAQDWYRFLRAANIAPSTVGQYRKVVDSLTEYLAEKGISSANKVTHRVLARYFSDLTERPLRRDPSKKVSAAYVSLHYRGLQQFWRWLVDVEQELADNPFGRMRPPHVPARPVPVLADQELRDLLAACSGNSFDARRDTALIRVLLDTGVRVSELTGLRLEDLDFPHSVLTVLGKGRRPRTVSFGNKTGEALRRYLRARQGHTRAEEPAVWLGRQGPMTAWGVRQVLERRGAESGVPHCNPHRFRHTFAHRWLADGNGETDLMRITGWRSREMVSQPVRRQCRRRASTGSSSPGSSGRLAVDTHPPRRVRGSLPSGAVMSLACSVPRRPPASADRLASRAGPS